MILICKNYKNEDKTAQDVVDWLLYRNAQFDFFSGSDFYENGNDWSLEVDDFNDQYSYQNKFKSVWFRGFMGYRDHLQKTIESMEMSKTNVSETRWFLGLEIRKTNAQIFHSFDNAYQLPKIDKISVDKFSILRKAKELGLSIPASLITNSKKELIDFVQKHKAIITKPLYETFSLIEENFISSFKMEIINITFVESLPEKFFPSFFQAYIKKEIELRVFYLEGEFYSSAIFSQLDPKTKHSFKNYNESKPNRVVPYLLPKKIENKLHHLMRELSLNTGSIDLIKTTDKKYIFLEINPTGQFGAFSKKCNYFLEDEIAKTLIKNDE